MSRKKLKGGVQVQKKHLRPKNLRPLHNPKAQSIQVSKFESHFTPNPRHITHTNSLSKFMSLLPPRRPIMIMPYLEATMCNNFCNYKIMFIIVSK